MARRQPLIGGLRKGDCEEKEYPGYEKYKIGNWRGGEGHVCVGEVVKKKCCVGRVTAEQGTMDANHVLRGQYWLTRVVFLRCLGFVYAAAFLSALRDNAALVRRRKRFVCEGGRKKQESEREWLTTARVLAPRAQARAFVAGRISWKYWTAQGCGGRVGAIGCVLFSFHSHDPTTEMSPLYNNNNNNSSISISGDFFLLFVHRATHARGIMLHRLLHTLTAVFLLR